MEKQIFIRPFERLHDRLRDIATGTKNLRISRKILNGLIDDNDDIKDIAQEAYEDESSFLHDLKPYVIVNPPVAVEGENETYDITQHLNDQGKEAWDNVNGGFIWNLSTQSVDLEATETFYRDMMASGSIEVRYVELVIDNKDERLQDLRSYMTYFKLSGNRIKKGSVEIIEKIKDAV